jgi:PAS domain S-box-containing protein
VIGDTTSMRQGDRLVVPVFVPIRRPESPAIALGMAIEPGRLSRILAARGFDGGGYATLIDADGTIVARSVDREELVGKRVPDGYVEDIRGRDAGLLHDSANRFGTKTIAAFRRLARAPGWRVIVVEPLADHRARLWSPLAALVVGGLAALAVALLVAGRIGRRVLRPVRLLTRRAEAVVASGGDVRGGPDELPAPTHVSEFERLQRAVGVAEATLRERSAAVAAAEAKLRAVVDTAMDAIVSIDEAGTIQSFNRSAESIFGYRADEAVGRNVSLLMGPGDAGWLEGRAAGLPRAGERGILGAGREVEGRRQGGAPVPLDLSVAEWRDAGGRRFFTGIMRDISARKADEARRLLLAREVDHRAKNALAVVQSVIRLTAADEPAAFAAAVGARVAALARAHSLLAEGGWSGADMRAVAEREVAPYAVARDGAGATSGLPTAGGPVVVLDGPPVPLAAASVQAFAMVLHELVANAAKHGALSAPGGRVDLTWSIGRRAGDDGKLRLRWAEAGGPAVDGAPTRRSFGTRMVEATVCGQLGGAVERHWESSGLVVEVAVPLDRTVAPGCNVPAVPSAA